MLCYVMLCYELCSSLYMQMKYGCFKMISFQQTNSRTQVTKTMNKWLSGEGIAIESFSSSTDD